MSHRLLLWSGIALVALGVAIGVVAAISDAQDDGAPPQFAGAVRAEGMRAADFRLTDQDGHPFALSSTRGRVVALTFLHSKCTSTCPVTLQTIRGALDDLTDDGIDSSEVDVVAVSVDPEEDTPRNVRRLLAAQRAEFVHYVNGPRPRLRRVWKSYGIGPQGEGREDHSAYVLLVDRRGRLRISFPSHLVTPEDLANDLGILLAEPAPS